MKKTLFAGAVCLLSVSALAETEAPSLAPVKAGDKVSLSVQQYEQKAAFTPPALQEKISSTSYTIVAGKGDESARKYSNGVSEVLARDQAIIAIITAAGERKDLRPSAVKHWMPASELKGGMKWAFTSLNEVPASNASEHMCQLDGRYDARASDAERDLKINGTLTHLKVTVIDIEGRINLRTCEGSALRSKERYVYSKDLNLVLEHDLLQQDAFGAMLGTTSNRQIKVSALTTAP